MGNEGALPSPILQYDPLSRVVRPEQPNGTEARVVFDAWMQEAWDENDAIDGTAWLAEWLALPAGDPERRAAELALAHAGTPTTQHLDPLGRVFLTIEEMGRTAKYETRLRLDIQGNQLLLTDAKGNSAAEQFFDPLQRNLRIDTPDAGPRWTLLDAVDAPVRTWDSLHSACRRRRSPV